MSVAEYVPRRPCGVTDWPRRGTPRSAGWPRCTVRRDASSCPASFSDHSPRDSSFPALTKPRHLSVTFRTWQKGRIAATHGRLNCVRQAEPMSDPSNRCFLGPTPLSNPNGISIGTAVFAQLITDDPYTLQWAALSIKIVPLRTWDLDPRLTHGSLGQPVSMSQTPSRSVQPFCRAHDRDRQTDRPRYSVCNNRPHLRRITATTRPKNCAHES